MTDTAAAAAEITALLDQAQHTTALLDALYGSAPVGLGFWDRDLRYVRVNDALARINDRSAEDHVGRTLAEVVPQLAAELEPLVRGVLETGEPVIEREMAGGTPSDPEAERYWSASYYPVTDRDGERIGVGGIVEEITDRRRAEQRTELQHGVTSLLVAADTVDEAVAGVLERICATLGWDVACYWALDPDAPRTTWAQRDANVEGFVAHTERASLTPAMLPGRVAASGEAEWLAELDPRVFPRATVAAAEGLRSGVAFPVLVEDEVVGVVEMFSRRPRARDADLLTSLRALGGQLGQYLRRQRAEEERGQLLQRERQARAEAEAAASTLRKLERVADAALQHLSLQDLLDALLQRIAEVLDADSAAILLIGDDGNLHLRAATGFGASVELATPIPVGSGMAGRVAASRTPLLVADLSQIAAVSPVLRDRGINSAVAIPLIVADRVIGVIHAGSEAFAQFVEEDARLLELIADRIALAINQATLHELERVAQERLQFLGEASALLASSLDVDETLQRVAQLAVPHFADWCAVDLVQPDGTLQRVAIAHVDPTRVELAGRLAAAFPSRVDDPRGIGAVVRSRTALLTEQIDPDALRAALADRPAYLHALLRLQLSSIIVAPLLVRDRTLGALTFVWAESGRHYDQADLGFAQELAARAAVAVDNAQLYRAAEEQAQAGRVLASVGDGVFLVDRSGCVRTWNHAAAAATGLSAGDVLDRLAVDAIPGWRAIEQRVTVGAGGTAPRAESLPLDLGGRELWLSIHGVAVPDGVVYAFRDLTEERALEQMRTEFVSTVSHELRTPLAAIYGAAMTLRRSDVALDEDQRAKLLDVVSGEADRLARTVNDILWASRLDTDTLHVNIQSCDPRALVDEVVRAQEAHLDPGHELVLEVADGLPQVAADLDKVGRVLINLVDNAVKYSPDGGRVSVTAMQVGAHVRFSVADTGLGVPPAEQRRVFEKFYRLDPDMNRGVGGTGLGLYICRELVRRMQGRIWVESAGLGQGSTFHVELPAAY
jgi:PAS domain S-box-containing protein